MTFHSGIKATATINGNTNELPTIKWSVSPKVEKVEFKNSKTGRYALKEMTFYDGTFSIAVDQDFDANPFDAPFNLIVGTVLTNVKLFLHGTADIFWLFPSAIIVGTPQEVTIDGKNTLQFDLENSGTFSYPGGFTPPA